MSAVKWEPLETADEVVAAYKAGRTVERKGLSYDWCPAEPTSRIGVHNLISTGRKYRARIEGGE